MKPIARDSPSTGEFGVVAKTSPRDPVVGRPTVEADSADEAGLRNAFLAHGGEMFGFACRMLGSRANAEDAVQETFARAWRSRSRYDPTLGSLRTWLFTIERRVILDVNARQSRSRTHSIDEGQEPPMADDLDAAVLGWQMETALGKLLAEHRRVLVEIYFNGRTGREVAELLGIPEGTVRSRAYYALRALRLHFEEGGWN